MNPATNHFLPLAPITPQGKKRSCEEIAVNHHRANKHEEKLKTIYRKLIEKPIESFQYLENIKGEFSTLKLNKIDKASKTYVFITNVFKKPSFKVIVTDKEEPVEVLTSSFAHNSRFISELLKSNKLDATIPFKCNYRLLKKINDLFNGTKLLKQFSANFNELLDLLRFNSHLLSKKIEEFAVMQLEEHFVGSFDTLEDPYLSYFNSLSFENPSLVPTYPVLQKMDQLNELLTVDLSYYSNDISFIDKLISQLLNNDSLISGYKDRFNEMLKIIKNSPNTKRLFNLEIAHNKLSSIQGIPLKSLNIIYKGGENSITQIIDDLCKLDNAKNLKELKFQEGFVLRDEHIEKIMLNCPSLSSFECNAIELTHQSCRYLAQLNLTALGLTNMAEDMTKTISLLLKPTLRKLNLEDGPALSTRLFMLINNMKDLEFLNLNLSEEYRDDHGDYCFKTLKNMINLKSLFISFSGITNASLIHISFNMPNLQTLVVSGCRLIDDSGIQVLAKPSLQMLNVSDCNRVTDHAFLKEEWKGLKTLSCKEGQFSIALEYLNKLNPQIIFDMKYESSSTSSEESDSPDESRRAPSQQSNSVEESSSTSSEENNTLMIEESDGSEVFIDESDDSYIAFIED